MKIKKTAATLALAFVMSQSISMVSLAATANNSLIEPHEAAYGYFVDAYKNNGNSNMAPETNPAIGVLSGYLKLWKPGSAWNNGTILNSTILNSNIQKVIDITSNRTYSEEHQAYLDDRRNQNYSVIDGLGPYTNAFIKEAGAATTIPDVIPDDAAKVQYTDHGDGKDNWADQKSELGSMVTLVETLRNSSASTTPAKNYYQYPRPWRWSTEVNVLPTLVPEKSSNPNTDGGFPSGHTNAATIAALALAYAAPERYQQLLTRASELGNDRIIAGMHSPLDVMGGRVMATAISAAALNDPNNQALKNTAYNDAHSKLILPENATSKDRFKSYNNNKKNYLQRLTYGFDVIGDTNQTMRVPKGAEVLLETRFPYLDSTQRRFVLYTTGLQSGYPLLDDAEGWGRLDLYEAADGYGEFLNDVTVNMDASKGGFNALDTWRNDISGDGKLTKQGTGELKLTGDNEYRGGTEIDAGDLEAASETALGDGSVTNDGGTLTKNVTGKLEINGAYTQSANSTLELNIKSKKDIFKVRGKAAFDGTLKLNFLKDYKPVNGQTIISCDGYSGQFSSIVTTGLPSGVKVNISNQNNKIVLQVSKN